MNDILAHRMHKTPPHGLIYCFSVFSLLIFNLTSQSEIDRDCIVI